MFALRKQAVGAPRRGSDEQRVERIRGQNAFDPALKVRDRGGLKARAVLRRRSNPVMNASSTRSGNSSAASMMRASSIGLTVKRFHKNAASVDAPPGSRRSTPSRSTQSSNSATDSALEPAWSASSAVSLTASPARPRSHIQQHAPILGQQAAQRDAQQPGRVSRHGEDLAKQRVVRSESTAHATYIGRSRRVSHASATPPSKSSHRARPPRRAAQPPWAC